MNRCSARHQRGSATLLLATVILFSITVVSLYGAKVAVMEQRISANQYRGSQAYLAAEAGLDAAISQLSRQAILTAGAASAGGILAGKSYTGTVTDPHNSPLGSYTVNYTNPTANNFDLLALTVTGTDATGTASHSFNLRVNYTAFLRNPPPGASVVRGSVTLSGSAKIMNTAAPGGNEITVWSGGATSAAPSNTVTSAGNGSGVIEDANLGALAPGDGFFENFFSAGRQDVENISAVVTCGAGGCTDTDVVNVASPNGLIWVNGDLSIVGNTQLGSSTNPIILIVDGALTLQHASASITGVVYTTQDWNGANNKSTVNGAIVVDGDFSTDRLTVNYDSGVLTTLQNRGVYVPVLGSWH